MIRVDKTLKYRNNNLAQKKTWVSTGEIVNCSEYTILQLSMVLQGII
jgi:hypothetical protein